LEDSVESGTEGCINDLLAWGEIRVSSGNKTFSFWWGFWQNDAFAYLCLYFGVRTRKWHLRVASLRLMGPYFLVCNRTHYKKLVPTHLAHLEEWPGSAIAFLKAGGFAVSQKGDPFMSIASDEAHETLINKDTKTAIKKIPGYNALALVGGHALSRALNYKNIRSELIRPRNSNVLAPLRREKKTRLGAHGGSEINIRSMRQQLRASVLVEKREPGEPLVHLVTGEKATARAEHDLAYYLDEGKKAFEQVFKDNVLRETSNAEPKKRFNLRGFGAKKEKGGKKAIADAVAAKKRTLHLAYKQAIDLRLTEESAF
jgi:hypothetical protein